LQTIGMALHYTSTVGDDLQRIVAVIRQGLARSAVVITTGGLGPTVDDLSREAMAQATGRPLVFDPDLLEQIRERFRGWGREMTDNNRRQAHRPKGSIVIENPVGTAPGFIVEENGRVAICLPGVPREMEYLLEHAVLPYLRRRFDLSAIIKSRELKVSGAGEGLIDERVGELEKLENPKVGLNAHGGFVVIRMTAIAGNEAEADRLIEPVEVTIRERLGDLVFGADADTLEGVVLAKLSQRGQTLAVVESGVGGRLAGKLAEADRGMGAFAGGRVMALPESADLIAVARQAASQVEADWGLACIIETVGRKIRFGIGLWNIAHSQQWRRGFATHPALAPEWSSNLALDALRKSLIQDKA
ncbi:MAG: molybdopterin-binding protein, partial [Methylococcaceae bacterium]|nr:molybdopterin-binding protein [Methylococcaceae bacterium]